MTINILRGGVSSSSEITLRGRKCGDYAQQVIRGRYFPHIDGIRAIAVLAVLLYHLEDGWCPGGFTGVDIFFVISGYLIGGGIIRDLREGKFSSADFYTRRIKRIMPAYFAVITATLLVGLSIYHYEPLASLGNAALRSSYFFANFFCYKFLGDYFAGDAGTHPLMNLWSLSVEEQFYIIVPLVVFLTWKLRRSCVLPALLFLLIISYIDAERLLASHIIRHHMKAFYFLEARAWELLSGVLLAWGLFNVPERGVSARKWAFAGAWIGVFSIVASLCFVNSGGHFPGAGALCAVAGSGLLIGLGERGWVGSFLTMKPLVWVGRISYSLYLWHWPIIAFTRYCYGEEKLPMGAILLASVLSFFFAYLSWRYIEMPIRRNKEITTRKAIGGLVVVCALVAGIGGLLQRTNGLVYYIHSDANQYESLNFPPRLRKWQDGHHGICQMDSLDEKGNRIHNVLEVLGKGEEKPSVFLMGDSHAEALKGGLSHVFSEHGIEGIVFGSKTCPLYGIEVANTFHNSIRGILSWLEKVPSLKTVIIMCRWDTRLSGNHSGQILYRVNQPVPHDDAANTFLLEEGLTETCRRLRDMGRDVVLVGPVPLLKLSPGTELRRRIMLGCDTSHIGEAISLREFEMKESPVFQILQRVSAATGARVVPVHPYLEQKGYFRGFYRNKLLYHDDNHLSYDGAEYVSSCILSKLIPLMDHKFHAM